MKVFVHMGGKGSRLNPVTKEENKYLVPILISLL